MGDPVTMAVVGGSVGAMMNKKDPLKGAMLGAMGGYGGATLLPTLGAGTAATGGMTGANVAGSSALTGAGASTAANTAFMAPAGVNSSALIGAGQTAPGIFSNVAAPLTVSQPLSSAAGQTAGMEKSYGVLESMFNPNIQSSSLNNSSGFFRDFGDQGQRFQLGNVGQFMQNNPVLTQMAYQTGRDLLSQQSPAPAPAGLMRGSPSQAQMPQYQVGVPKVSLI